MAVLKAAQRNKLPSKSFAGPDRSYPINDPSHARNALSRVSQHGSPALQKRVRAAVHRKYPGIGQREEGGEVEESAAHERAEMEHERAERKTIASLKKMQTSEGHAGREKKAINKLERLEEDEHLEQRARGGPVRPKRMASTIGSRGMRDNGPQYPSIAKNYVR